MKHILLIGMLFLMPMVGGCSTNPATGQSQLNALSQDQEVQIGEENAPVFLKEYGGPVPDEQLNQYVNDLGRRLAKESERPDLPWEFHVLDSSVVNAFALPGGKVFISRALLAEMTNEAQLAGVLGHEIGHVTAQHIGQQMTQAMIVQGLATGVGVAAGIATDEDYASVLGVGAGAAGSLYILKFGRDQESQADELGLRYMTKLGYNPRAQIQVMRILKEASGSGGGPPEFLATHPYPDTRIERLQKLIAREYPQAGRQNNPYTVNAPQFERNVLERLRQLPAPKHNPQ